MPRFLVALMMASIGAALALFAQWYWATPYFWAFRLEPDLWSKLLGLIGNTLVLAAIIFFVALLPVSAFIFFSEARQLRSPLAHIPAGALIGMLCYYAFAALARTGPGPFPDESLAFGIAGLVAGFIYWAIAGRKAGDP